MKPRTLKLFLYRQHIAMILSQFMLIFSLLFLVYAQGQYRYLTMSMRTYQAMDLGPLHYVTYDFETDMKTIEAHLSELPQVRDLVMIRSPHILFHPGSHFGEHPIDVRLFDDRDMAHSPDTRSALRNSNSYENHTSRVFALVPHNYGLSVGDVEQATYDGLPLEIEIVGIQPESQLNWQMNIQGNQTGIHDLLNNTPVAYILDPHHQLNHEQEHIHMGLLVLLKPNMDDTEHARLIQAYRSDGAVTAFDNIDMLNVSDDAIGILGKRRLLLPVILCITAFILFESLTVLRFHRLRQRLRLFRFLGLDRRSVLRGLNFWSTLIAAVAGIIALGFTLLLTHLNTTARVTEDIWIDISTYATVVGYLLICVAVQRIINRLLLRSESLLWIHSE